MDAKTESTTDDDSRSKPSSYSFLQVLPSSIEIVEVTNLSAIEQVDNLLADIVEGKSKALPNLKEIKLSYFFWEEHIARMNFYVHACDKVGVTLHLCEY